MLLGMGVWVDFGVGVSDAVLIVAILGGVGRILVVLRAGSVFSRDFFAVWGWYNIHF